ncbi:MAG: sigma-54-dependent Fis family transcriptional regulator [Planctomycetota bacterium]|nr:MAG: sigma-54-dependent Fis family transcriptional regulator [Planctomycetota bacterium]
MRAMLETVLSLTYDVRTFADPREALLALEREPADVVVTDFRLPGLDGLEVLARLRRSAPETPVIVMTAYGTVEQAVRAMREGAFDYIAKPFEPEEMALAIGRALEHRRLQRRASALEREVAGSRGRGELVGSSPAMQRVRALIERVGPLDVTVLVTGRTGTGKELVARALHAASPRREAPFVVVHCAAMPRELLESELFGHVRGAFSGAGAARRGLVGEAQGGTLFLDDVNYLDLDLQAKVNRLVQEREVRPVGGDRWRRVDVRIVAAANVDLLEAVRQGRFREDLYYRLQVVEIALPPLSERPEDIPELVRHFADKHGRRLGRPAVSIEPEALGALAQRSWPGNVRELENAVERALILGDGARLDRAAFALGRAAAPASGGEAIELPYALPYAEAMERVQQQAAARYLRRLLERTAGNVSEAARLAGMARQSLHRLLRRAGIDAVDFRRADTGAAADDR